MRKRTIIEIYHDDDVELNAEFMERNIMPNIACSIACGGLVAESHDGNMRIFVRSFEKPIGQIEKSCEIERMWELNPK